jgi:hypothetical protein
MMVFFVSGHGIVFLVSHLTKICVIVFRLTRYRKSSILCLYVFGTELWDLIMSKIVFLLVY